MILCPSSLHDDDGNLDGIEKLGDVDGIDAVGEIVGDEDGTYQETEYLQTFLVFFRKKCYKILMGIVLILLSRWEIKLELTDLCKSN